MQLPIPAKAGRYLEAMRLFRSRGIRCSYAIPLGHNSAAFTSECGLKVHAMTHRPTCGKL